MTSDKIGTEDQIAPGPSRDHCPRWPDDATDGHNMISTKPARTSMWVRSCTYCGWIDGEDLDEQRVAAEARGRAGAIADLRDERAYALWWNEQLDLPPSTWTGPWTREQFAAYLEAKGHPELSVDQWARVEVIHPDGGVEPIVGEMAEFEVGPFDAAIGALRAEANRLDAICPPEIDLGFRGHREAANWLEFADDEAKGHQPWLPPHA